MVERPDQPPVEPMAPARRWAFAVLGYGFALFCLVLVWVAYALTIHLPAQPLPDEAIFAGAATLGLIIVAVSCLRRTTSVVRMLGFVAVSAVFLSCLVALHGSSKSRFKAAYRSIHPGMTEAEVRAVIDDYFPDRKPSIRFGPRGGYVGYDGLGRGSYAEFFGVWFRDGVVSFKEYLPD